MACQIDLGGDTAMILTKVKPPVKTTTYYFTVTFVYLNRNVIHLASLKYWLLLTILRL